uniref:Target of rapamycin complex subunit lst8 n=1 Tax=Panagrolaimus superbus TaxID=310955 RepID=A0A914YWD6_9BILA
MSRRPLLFTASYDETIRMWDVVDQRQLESIAIKDTQTNALSIKPNDGSQIAAACYQTLRLFDCCHLGNQPLQVFNVHDRNVTTMGFSHDGSWIFTGSEDQTAKVWDLRSNTLVCQRILQLNSTVNSIALHPKSHVELIVADSAGGIFLWDIRTNRDDSLQTELSYTEFVTNLDIDKFGKHVAAITNKGNCFVYSTQSDSMLGPDSNQLYSETELNPDPFGATPSPTHLQNDHRPKPVIFQPHKQYGLKCKFLPNGTGFVTTAGDDVPKLWDITSKDENGGIKLKQTFHGEPKKGRKSQEFDNNVNMKWIWDIAFTNDSTKIFTAGSDNLLRMFDVNSGQLLRRYQGHSKGITCMAFWEPN